MSDFKGRKDFPEVADDKIKIGDYSGWNRLSVVDIYSPKAEPELRDRMMEPIKGKTNNYDSPLLSQQPVIVLSDVKTEANIINAIDGYLGKADKDVSRGFPDTPPVKIGPPAGMDSQTFEHLKTMGAAKQGRQANVTPVEKAIAPPTRDSGESSKDFQDRTKWTDKKNLEIGRTMREGEKKSRGSGVAKATPGVRHKRQMKEWERQEVQDRAAAPPPPKPKRTVAKADSIEKKVKGSNPAYRFGAGAGTSVIPVGGTTKLGKKTTGKSGPVTSYMPGDPGYDEKKEENEAQNKYRQQGHTERRPLVTPLDKAHVKKSTDLEEGFRSWSYQG